VTILPTSPVLRGPRDLRERVDAKLGSGVGMPMTEARDRLSPAERAEWALGECLFAMLDKRFHIWVQGWCLDRGVDGPAAVAAIAEAARPLDGVVADLLRWTSNRGVWARTGERPDALMTVVPEVWHGAWHRVKPFMEALAQRWPEDVDPFALPAPAPWTRTAGTVPVRLTFPDPTPDGVVEATAHALWAGGASEDQLDEFYRGLGPNLPEGLDRWVRFEPGELEALRAALHPPDPLAALAGVEKLAFPSLLVVPPEREAELLQAAAFYRHVELRPSPERPFGPALRSALRMDPDVLVAWARDVKAEDVDLLVTALETGHLVALLGEVPGLAERAAGSGVPLLIK
jgi:hypothetical protein